VPPKASRYDVALWSLAANVRRLREAQGLTQEQAAEAAAVSAIYFRQIELGTAKNPSLKTLEHLAEGLDVPVAELLEDAPRPVKRNPGRPPRER
jgi:transcriptional regulator with XRE-family HTH domain